MMLTEHLNEIDDLTRRGLEAKEQRPFLFEIGSVVRKIRQEMAESKKHSDNNDPDAA